MLYVVRHGQTEWNLQQRYQGHQDSPLTGLGRRQAQAVARRLKNIPFDRIHASPIGRAWITAGFVAEETGLQPNADDRLKECGYGECEGLTIEEIDAKFPGKFAWREVDKWTRRLPGAECYDDLRIRARSFATEHLTGVMQADGPTVGIVAHDAINRSLCGYLHDWSREEIMFSRQANNDIFVLDDDGFHSIDVNVD